MSYATDPAAHVMAIGLAAEAAGVTTRTLRYYEQLGMLEPAARSVGGARRYSQTDVDRVRRIRQLQDLLGHDLDQIRAALDAEDRIAELRAEWHGNTSRKRREAILAEATDINAELRKQVRGRVEALERFARELDDKAKQYRQVAKDL